MSNQFNKLRFRVVQLPAGFAVQVTQDLIMENWSIARIYKSYKEAAIFVKACVNAISNHEEEQLTSNN